MVIVKINGGLGNQMFQYAYAWSIARQRGESICLDLSMYKYGCGRKFELDKLQSPRYEVKIFYVKKVKIRWLHLSIRVFEEFIKSVRLIGYRRVNEAVSGIDKQGMINVKRVYLQGYWIGQNFFFDCEEDIRRFFKLRNKSKALQSCEKKMHQEKSVAVHIRRGDYVALNWCIEPMYYKHAIQKMRELIGDNISYYVFTDDIVYSKSILKEILEDEEAIYYVGECYELEDIEELFAMAACKHQIIVNSTYSWWGAWLNDNPDKKVISPKTKNWKQDINPKEWMLIDCF